MPPEFAIMIQTPHVTCHHKQVLVRTLQLGSRLADVRKVIRVNFG